MTMIMSTPANVDSSSVRRSSKSALGEEDDLRLSATNSTLDTSESQAFGLDKSTTQGSSSVLTPSECSEDDDIDTDDEQTSSNLSPLGPDGQRCLSRSSGTSDLMVDSQKAERRNSTSRLMGALKTPVRMAKTPVRVAGKSLTEALSLSTKVSQGAINISGKVANKSMKVSGKVSSSAISLSNKGIKKVSKSMQSLTSARSSENLQASEDSEAKESRANAEFDLRVSKALSKGNSNSGTDGNTTGDSSNLSTPLKKRRAKIRRSSSKEEIQKSKSAGELSDMSRRSNRAAKSSSSGKNSSRRRRRTNTTSPLGDLASSGHSKSTTRGRKSSSGNNERRGRGRSVSVAVSSRAKENKARGRSISVSVTAKTGRGERRDRGSSVSAAPRPFKPNSVLPLNASKPKPVPTTTTHIANEPLVVATIPAYSEKSASASSRKSASPGPSTVANRLSTSRHGSPRNLTNNNRQSSSRNLNNNNRQSSSRNLTNSKYGPNDNLSRQASSRSLRGGATMRKAPTRASMDLLVSGLSGHGEVIPTPTPAPPVVVDIPIQQSHGTVENSLEPSAKTLSCSYSDTESFASDGAEVETEMLPAPTKLKPLPPRTPTKSWTCPCGESNCESFNFCGVCGSKPAPVALTWECDCCNRKDNAARFKFCVGCGTSK